MKMRTHRAWFQGALALTTSLTAVSAQARIAIIENNSEVIEIPRSQIKTYMQKGTLNESLKPVKAVKPGELSDDELAAIPERYLPPELRQKQKDAVQRLKKSDEARKKGVAPELFAPSKETEVVKVKSKKNNKVINLKIDEAVWVPPTTATDDAILAPQRKLPDVELLQAIEVQTSGAVKKEIAPGERRELIELFKDGKTNDADKRPLLQAFRFYQERDYATSLTLALGVMSDPKSSRDLKLNARFVLAHSLYQAGFYASALPQLIELVPTKWRRSAIGMLATTLEKTRDDSGANQVLAQVSLSQIQENYRPLFSFHLGRILLNTGAREAALAAFKRVPVDHKRFPEAQYYIGVIRAAEVPSSVTADDWDKKDSRVNIAREHFETALTSGRTANAQDLLNLVKLSLARLAYQAKQYNQSIYQYQEVATDSPFAREATYESAWSLYRISEFNRSLGVLHPLGSPYFEGRDVPELWILRSLNYLKLCRFDESKRAANTFEATLKELSPELLAAEASIKKTELREPSGIAQLGIADWIRQVLLTDPVIQKDLTTETLLKLERGRLEVLSHNLRIDDLELRDSTVKALQAQIDHKLMAVGRALKPYLMNRVSDILSEYSAQKQRLDFLRFEIYSQATRFPKALERPEAKKLLAESEFLPGVFTKGHEILWKFSGEYWRDELRSYDYFIPTECRSEDL